MDRTAADHNLLFGILAVQMGFVGREPFLAALHAWVREKDKPLGQVLLEQEALTADSHALLEALVQKHLSLHNHDVRKSLAAVSAVGPASQDLQTIVDLRMQAGLDSGCAAWSREDDPQRTVSLGTPTSAGTRFRILRPHARGGLGQVSVALDEELHREVALKEIQDHRADDAASRARFVLEAEITGGLEHPGIVPVYGLGTHAGGRPFYAMRFIRGDSLQSAIKRFHQAGAGRDAGEHSLELRRLLGRFIAVCQAIQYAHDRGILHRDLKPGNIMLGKYGETLVVDWGLAKVLDGAGTPPPAGGAEEPRLRPWSADGSDQTVAGTAVGTPAYMSPEQAAGRLDRLGPASDVYSLGATLYALLTGKPPVAGKQAAEVLARVRRGDFPRPRQQRPEVPAGLEAICLKALALQPGGRYPSPRALADDLERWLGDEPVSALPEPVAVKVGRWMRRHKPLVSGAAAAFLVGVIAVSAGVLWHARQQADAARQQAVAGEKVRRGLELARQTRDALHSTLKQPGGVQRLLNEPARWQAQLKAARSEWRRARDHVGAAADPRWADRLRELDEDLRRDQADHDLALRLEKIRLDRGNVVRGTFGGGMFREYPAAFAEAGLVPAPGRQKEAALRITQSPIKDQLLAALDDWAYWEHRARHPDLAGRLLGIARRADPDPWRDKIRDPALLKNQQGVVKYAREALRDDESLARLSPQMLNLVALRLPNGPTKTTWLRTAQALHPADFWINYSIAYSLAKEDARTATGYFRAALAVRPNNAAVYNGLGMALHNQGDRPAAIAAYKQALAIDPNLAAAWTNLGFVFYDQNDRPAAIAAFRKALAVDPNLAGAWNNLGYALYQQKDLPAAIAAFNKALACDPQLAAAWNNLGLARQSQKNLPAAIDSFKKALAIDPQTAFARQNLASAQENLALEKRLPRVLQGEAAGVAELLALANFCQYHAERYRAAVALYTRAFAAEPTAAEDLAKSHRYDAACAAALASVGRGADAAKLDATEKTRLRKEALAWLRAELAARGNLLEKRHRTNPLAVVRLGDFLRRWQRDADFDGLRDDHELAKLPADEHAAWTKLWGEVDRLAWDARSRYTRSVHKGRLGGRQRDQSYPIKMLAGRTYVIDVESARFGTLLRLESNEGKVVAENDRLNPTTPISRIVFAAPRDGAYRIVATSLPPGGTGTYTVTVREFAVKR